MLEVVADSIWTHTQPRPFMGLRFGVRMTVVRLPDGSLLLHSPLAVTAELKAAVDQLGEVRHVVAPNKLHHLWVGDWALAYPTATLHAPAGLARKRKDLEIGRPLGEPDPAWGGALEVLSLEGIPTFDESCFLHRDSGTLISADLVLALPSPVTHWWTRGYLKLAGIHGQPMGCSLVHKAATRDKAAFRRSIDAVIAADWSRLVVSHGVVLQRDDLHDLLREAYAWLKA